MIIIMVIIIIKQQNHFSHTSSRIIYIRTLVLNNFVIIYISYCRFLISYSLTYIDIYIYHGIFLEGDTAYGIKMINFYISIEKMEYCL